MKKSERTKKKIEDVAIETFLRKGFNGATTAEIAEGAGVAEGTIFRYFPTKKTILSSLLLTFINRFGQSFVMDSLVKVFDEQKDKSVTAFLKAVVLDRYQLFKENSDIIYVIFSEVKYHPDLKESLRVNIIEIILEFVVKAMDEIGTGEDIRSDIDLQIAVRSFIGASIIAIVQREWFYMESVNKPFEEELDSMIDIYLNGIRKR